MKPKKQRPMREIAAALGIAAGFTFLFALWSSAEASNENVFPALIFLLAIASAIAVLLGSPGKAKECKAGHASQHNK